MVTHLVQVPARRYAELEAAAGDLVDRSNLTGEQQRVIYGRIAGPRPDPDPGRRDGCGGQRDEWIEEVRVHFVTRLVEQLPLARRQVGALGHEQ